MSNRLYGTLAAAALSVALVTTLPAADPIELGKVRWGRDFAAATAAAKRDGKPMLVLFDEVPGCETCKNFGRGPLAHPMVVAGAGEFVAVAVCNNVPGVDADVLKRFGEAAWNNPVLRFVDADGRDLIPRKEGISTTPAVLERMVTALGKAGRPIPEYLKSAAEEYNPSSRAKAVFAMHCYWEGESKLGVQPGVLATRIGMLGKDEVVEVVYDPKLADYRKLVEKAVTLDCTHRVYARSDEQLALAKAVVGQKAVRSDAAIDDRTAQQYHLAQVSEYHYLPLTALQATRVNAAIANRQSPDGLLSPDQLALRPQIKAVAARNAKPLAALKPDRSADGVIKYAQALELALAK